MKQHVPQGTTLLECPTLKKNCEVTFEVNVFRSLKHGGLEATGCSEFLPNTNSGNCKQKCIHTPAAQQLHQQAIRQHQHELSTIGSNVMG